MSYKIQLETIQMTCIYEYLQIIACEYPVILTQFHLNFHINKDPHQKKHGFLGRNPQRFICAQHPRSAIYLHDSVKRFHGPEVDSDGTSRGIFTYPTWRIIP